MNLVFGLNLLISIKCVLTSAIPSSAAEGMKVGSKPGKVGKRNGADFGASAGFSGLLRS